MTDGIYLGQGARVCAGRSVAEMEMLLVISTLARTFRFDLHESTTKESMRYDHFAVFST